MIFVTVGTHEQPFDRLIRMVDTLVGNGTITEEVVIQTGYSTYEPKHCQYKKLFPYSEMLRLVDEANIVITHGGPSSFIMPLQIGKIPIVVPRQFQFNEHVNDHQVKFVHEVAKRMGTIIESDVDGLAEKIIRYNDIIKNMRLKNVSNNSEFNTRLEDAVKKLF